METRSKLEKLTEWLSKHWKIALGFFGSLILFFAFRQKDKDYRENLENLKKSKDGEIKAENKAALDLEKANLDSKENLEKELQKLNSRIENRKKNLEDQKADSKKELEENGVSKSIAEMLGAEVVSSSESEN